MCEEYWEVVFRYAAGSGIQLSNSFASEEAALTNWDEIEASEDLEPICIKHVTIIAGNRP